MITVGPHDFRASVWGTGSFTVNDFLGWSDLVSHQEDPGRIRAGIRQLTAPRRVARTAATLPLGESARTLLGTGAPWFESWVEHTDRDDPFWDRLRFPAALDRVQVPVLLVGGWQDIFLRQTLQQYRHLRDRGVHVALTVGPWTHTQMLTKGLATGARESLDWLDAHLGRAPALRPSPVRVFVTGQGWRHLPDWPPATTERAWYLQPGGRLGESAPASGTPPATFRYHPADPTPTTGGPLLSSNGGYRDDSRLATRADVLCFTGAPSPTTSACTETPSSSWCTARTTPTSTCSFGSARWTRRAGPAMSATATGALVTRRSWSASSWTPSPTDSAPTPASGC